MFDIGFLELVLVGVVALLVVGPERLPKLARTAGLWMGRARRTLATVKAEIDSELKAEELKEILKKVEENAEKLHEERKRRQSGGGTKPAMTSTRQAGGSKKPAGAKTKAKT